MAEISDLTQADVVKLLRGSRVVMLTTALADGKLLAHPMSPQEVSDDADVWFFLSLASGQADALRRGPNANIAVAEAGSWLSVACRVELVEDRAKVEELWSDGAEAYVEGRDDPNLTLVRAVGESAQYWGVPGGKVSALAQLVKAKVSGERPAGGTSTTEL
ncbi:pyridoxamine 5'-phosphate oxidase family protein [Georgenia sp. Z1491]|uniref:pyridoxamine 5'-phosphate oxidase family protein n=1 Tax=Georgenia sp. Z1491 TaxID=3416707 RepID=UPI003CF65FCD